MRARTALIAGMTLALAIGLPAQTVSTDIVAKLMPRGDPSNVAHLSEADRTQAITQLQSAQLKATGRRAQAIAFLLATYGVQYPKNRGFLVHTLTGCNSPDVKFDCDEETGAYLIQLYKRGHKELLKPLILTGRDSRQAALAEELGDFYADVLVQDTSQFLNMIRQQPPRIQTKLCDAAGISDGSGMSPNQLQSARQNLKKIGDPVALRCLKAVEKANAN